MFEIFQVKQTLFQDYLASRGLTWKNMLNESLLALQRGVFMLSGALCSLLSTYNCVCVWAIKRFDVLYVHSLWCHDIFVKSDFLFLTLTSCANCTFLQITELLGTQCFATVVASAAFENLPTSTGKIFLLLNCQVGFALHSTEEVS